MKRNSITTADALSVGDRFYRLGDKAKTLHRVKGHTLRQVETEYQVTGGAWLGKDISNATEVVYLCGDEGIRNKAISAKEI